MIPSTGARLIWHADMDPGVLRVRARATSPDDPDALDPVSLSKWASLVRGPEGGEHLVLSDGWRHIRVDVVEGSLCGPGVVRLDYLLSGLSGVDAHLLTLRRLLALCRGGAFARTLFPAEPGLSRRLEALRVGDALVDGASYRDIAVALFGEDRVRAEWKGVSDSLLSHVRRRAAEARTMSQDGWRQLLAV